MTATLPTVTVIMPIRNERAHIRACLLSVLAADYPPERLEILALDGMSDDGTREILEDLAREHPRLHLVDNPARLIPQALNRGIAQAKGEVIVRLDAHALYPVDYIRLAVARLLESGAANVGGIWETVPGAATPMARAIALALAHPLGVGNARYRTGTTEPVLVDTVPFGCWRRQLLQDLGGFATDLPCNEDDELNARIQAKGGRILLDPAIRCRYVARATLGRLALMLYQYGYYKPFVAKRLGRLTTLRQLAPPLLVATLILLLLAGAFWPTAWLLLLAILALHLGAGLAAGLGSSRPWPEILRLPLVFATMHAAYGWGYLSGLLDLLGGGQPLAAFRLTR